MSIKLLSDDELLKLVDEDKPEALTEYGRRLLKKDNLREGRKFLTLSAILGDADAQIELGRICEGEENFEDAYQYYCSAYNQGVDSVLTDIARLLMMSDKKLALRILIANASEGNMDCLDMLIKVYESEGNISEANFWINKRDTVRLEGEEDEKPPVFRQERTETPEEERGDGGAEEFDFDVPDMQVAENAPAKKPAAKKKKSAKKKKRKTVKR